MGIRQFKSTDFTEEDRIESFVSHYGFVSETFKAEDFLNLAREYAPNYRHDSDVDFSPSVKRMVLKSYKTELFARLKSLLLEGFKDDEEHGKVSALYQTDDDKHVVLKMGDCIVSYMNALVLHEDGSLRKIVILQVESLFSNFNEDIADWPSVNLMLAPAVLRPDGSLQPFDGWNDCQE